MFTIFDKDCWKHGKTNPGPENYHLLGKVSQYADSFSRPQFEWFLKINLGHRVDSYNPKSGLSIYANQRLLHHETAKLSFICAVAVDKLNKLARNFIFQI